MRQCSNQLSQLASAIKFLRAGTAAINLELGLRPASGDSAGLDGPDAVSMPTPPQPTRPDDL